MITKSRVTGQNVLEIFENFTRDRTLPKFTKEESPVGMYTVISNTGFISSASSGTTIMMGSGNSFSDGTESSGVFINSGETGVKKKKLGFLAHISGFFKRKEKKVNVNKVFLQVFETLEQLKDFKEREDYINKAMEVAKKNGQTALLEKIKSTRETHLFESQLLALGFVKVISEEQLVKFAFDCERGLRLDWVKNFTRNIPAEVTEKKVRADQLKVFDNYVILHYDPENKHNTLTKEEIDKKKDPILFGVCEGTRKLYYVGDWKDEYCDLTFEDLIAKIGEENLKIEKEVK